MRRWTQSWAVLTAAAIAACSSAFDDSAASDSRGAGPGTGASAGGASQGGSTLGTSTGTVVPPEQEEDQSFRAPVVSGRWVWTANPDTGKVAVIDATTFSVRLADAGQAPTYLTALPSAKNTSKALVINVKSQDATLLSAGDTGAVSALDPIPLQADANTWTVSKSGKFAVAWTDSQAFTADPAQFYQDITVIDLSGTTPIPKRLVVGQLPSRVFINDDETRAFVVATSGISVIDLTAADGPRVVSEEPVSRNLKDDATTRDVSVLPDGSYALVRHEGSAIVTLVKLADGTLSDVTLPGPVTDLDLVPDAKSALAVVRGDPPPSSGAPTSNGSDAGNPDAGNSDAGNPDAPAKDIVFDGGSNDASVGGTSSVTADAGSPEAGAAQGGASEGGAAQGGSAEGGAQNGSVPLRSTLAILPIPGIFSAPSSFDSVSIEEVFGLVNIAPQGTQALLYTNAVASSHITVLQTARGLSYEKYRTIDVHGDVHDVFPSPDGAYAIASLIPQGTTGKPGFAVLPVDAALPSYTQTTEAPVFATAQISTPQPRAIITVSDGATNFAAYVVRMPELVVDRVQLPSAPLAGATGLVPDAGMAYIAESHPEGRITFIDLETGLPRTITGFEIAAKVVDDN